MDYLIIYNLYLFNLLQGERCKGKEVNLQKRNIEELPVDHQRKRKERVPEKKYQYSKKFINQ